MQFARKQDAAGGLNPRRSRTANLCMSLTAAPDSKRWPVTRTENWCQATVIHLGGSVHERDNGGDFFACHDNGDVDLLVGANGIDAVLQRMVEDALVKEDQGIHRLVLGGGSDVCVYGEVGQERFDLGFGGEELLTGPRGNERTIQST